VIRTIIECRFPDTRPDRTVVAMRPDVLLLADDPEASVVAAAKQCSNWGRWGADDVRGTLNFLAEAKRIEGAALVRTGVSFSLAQRFEAEGPQRGWRRRTNPVHTMLDTGLDAERGQGFPHGIGGADDVIFMPLQCSTQWDGLGHIFDHGMAWNGRRAGEVVTSEGDRLTGIEQVADLIAGRAVLLDVGRVLGEGGELPDGFAITPEHLDVVADRQGVAVGRGDIVLVRTGQLTRVRREGWGEYAGGAAPGLSFLSAAWLHETEIAAIATDTWGFEVRPNEFDVAFQPLHQVAIPHIGLTIGEMWDLDALARECAADGRYEFFLAAGPLPVTGAVGAPVNPIAVK
jgi:kynurenine formamidase